jgi:hypothetical protein
VVTDLRPPAAVTDTLDGAGVALHVVGG